MGDRNDFVWKERIKEIAPLNGDAMKASKQHWDNIGKPIEGLGLLEDMIIQAAGIIGHENVKFDRKCILSLCSDNGIVEEGVTQTDQQVTAIVAKNFAKGIASVNMLSDYSQTKVFAVDIGVASDMTQEGMIHRKVAYGTKNFLKEPAMTREQTERAIQIGIDLVRDKKEEGYELIGTGEMGIGNTTTTSAVAAVLLGREVEQVTGKGAGLSKEGVAHKIQVIKEGIRLRKPNRADVIDVLGKVGGLDIAGLTGIFLGGGLYGIPIVIDGAISAVAALAAKRLQENSKYYMLASHMGKEPVCSLLMEELECEPIIYGRLALGEGTGAAMLFALLDMALAVYKQNKTFEDIQVDAYEKYT